MSIVPGPRIAPRPAYWKCRRVAAPFKLFLVRAPLLACRKLCKRVSKRVDELCKRVERVSSESMSSHCGFPITPLRSTKRCDNVPGTLSYGLRGENNAPRHAHFGVISAYRCCIGSNLWSNHRGGERSKRRRHAERFHNS